jgi:nucleoside-diphosphate-sugar epimerase
MTNSATRTALVLGASGGIGGETGAALARHGWAIRALSRRGAPAQDLTGWSWIQGDAMDPHSFTIAAKGARVIVHAVNPPGYKKWDKLVLPMIENTIDAAKASGARIVLPGTIYNYGPDAFPILREESPQHATTPQGTIRIALEKRLEESAQEGVCSLIVRFGDFFGPRPGNNWFSQGLVKARRPVKSITYPGKKGTGHDWAYLPDAAETIAQLLDREDQLQPFARFHFRGHWDSDGTQLIAAIRKAVGDSSIKTAPLPWVLLRMLSPFSETLPGICAMRPHWQEPVELDNSRLVAFLGQEPHTPLDEAVTATLRGLGCIS